MSSEGKLLAFPVSEVPEMPRGKGNKLYDIPGKKAASREELMTGVAVVPPNGNLVMCAGEKQKTLDWSDLKEYRGERAQRGSVLPRGWPRKVDRSKPSRPHPPKLTADSTGQRSSAVVRPCLTYALMLSGGRLLTLVRCASFSERSGSRVPFRCSLVVNSSISRERATSQPCHGKQASRRLCPEHLDPITTGNAIHGRR